MGTLRSRRFLRCFYCGQRSNLRFEAQKSFDCSNCDATNWLDRNGEITDPPAATGGLEHTKVQYAVPRSSVPPRSPSPLSPLPPLDTAAGPAADDSIFCATCLRNQQILSSSLAQFEWPDDSTSAEHKARERKFWSLRKELESRYPQACKECLPKVNKKLLQASYTAQTDHLRRMMDRTRMRRMTVKRRGLLDFVDTLGGACWYAGFVFQGAWHLTVICLLLTESYTSTPQDGDWMHAILGSFHRICTLMLPYPDWLMQWAINLGMCSFPWNPRFKQSIRGFTAHILGFRQWYTYQLLALLERFVALSIAQYSKSQGLPTTTQLSAQLIIPLLMIYVFLAAKKSIHTDTTPLFRQPAELTAGSRLESDRGPATNDPGDLSSILDDILQSRNSPQQSRPATAGLSSQKHDNGRWRSQSISSSEAIDEPIQSPGEESHIARSDDEMDWAPSGSQYRAFDSYNAFKVKNTNPRFSDAPIEPKSGPIWYKVPPAPTNPAQRLRNPPMRPIIRESPQVKEKPFFQSTGQQPIAIGSRPQESSAQLNLAPPKFYAPEPKEDPRDSLSSIFASSFTLDSTLEDDEKLHTWKSGTSDIHGQTIPNRTMTRVAELVALLVALWGWIFALGSEEYYGQSVALASVCVYLIVSIRLAADLEVDHQIRGDTRPSVLTPSFANLALAQVMVVILLMWKVWSEHVTCESSGLYGNTLFGGIIMHHLVHIFV
ncbi:hypothetical protein F5Y12DRAFT_736833 [Xylaria sp. FL1777]|nr:hypothetical protein F5Y12DRAFT_736833 [Xylaria sp. FL1777]